MAVRPMSQTRNHSSLRFSKLVKMHQKELQAQLVGQRTLALWEITSVVISCLIAEWVVLSFFGRNRALVAIPVLLALILMLASHQTYEEDRRELCFSIQTFLAAVLLLVLSPFS